MRVLVATKHLQGKHDQSTHGGVPVFSTAAEYNGWARKQFGEYVKFDFHGLDLGAAHAVATSLHKFSQQYPQAFFLRTVRLGKSDDFERNQAASTEDGRVLLFNPRYFAPGNVERLVDSIKYAEQDEQIIAGASRNPLKYVVTHELGHVLYGWAVDGESMGLREGPAYGVRQEISNWAANLSKANRQAGKPSLSNRAGANSREAFAEAFAAAQLLPKVKQPLAAKQLSGFLRRAKASAEEETAERMRRADDLEKQLWEKYGISDSGKSAATKHLSGQHDQSAHGRGSVGLPERLLQTRWEHTSCEQRQSAAKALLADMLPVPEYPDISWAEIRSGHAVLKHLSGQHDCNDV